MTPAPLPPVAELTPHQGTMLLLDHLVEARPLGVTAATTIRGDRFFADARGTGAWIGIELMAQAIAAWAGLQARQRGEAIKVGFLVGTRKYQCERAWFAAGEQLIITVEQAFQADNGLGSFDCSITIDGSTVATASLTVFQPANAGEFLEDIAA